MSAAPLRIALLAPIGNSLYSRLVAHLVVAEPGLELVQIVVRTPWNLSRIRSEFRRDGTRLISKVRLKLLVGEDREAPSVSAPQSIDTIASLAREVRLTATNLNELAAPRKIPYSTVPDHNNPAALKALRAAAPDVVAFTGGGMVRKELL
jgi:hypothetical protein